MNELNFGQAVEALKQGKKVARKGWNGKGMFLFLIKYPKQLNVEIFTPKHEGTYELLPWIGMKTADNKFVPWLASQTDILSEDWEILN
jgi:hypothetical protein